MNPIFVNIPDIVYNFCNLFRAWEIQSKFIIYKIKTIKSTRKNSYLSIGISLNFIDYVN